MIVAASGVVWTLFFKQQQTQTGTEPPPPPPPIADVNETIEARHLTNVEGSGPLAIVEFTDFQCPFCARHAKETLPALKKALAGKVRYAVVNLPLAIHPHAIGAAEASECAADQGKYWEMHDLLFARQREIPTADYAVYAEELGLDVPRLGSCLATDEKLKKIRGDKALAESLGARATPTIFLGHMRLDGGVDLKKRVNGSVGLEAVLDVVTKLSKSEGR